MAHNCNDRADHVPLPTLHHNGVCTGNRDRCEFYHARSNTNGYMVCDQCCDHSEHLLGPTRPPLMPLPGVDRHLDRLSAGNQAGAPVIQTGYGPPRQFHGIQSWQTAQEFQTGALGHRQPPYYFPGFLTRVCRACEDSILHEIHLRTRGAAIHNGSETDDWEVVPGIFCTCKVKLGLVAPPAPAMPGAGIPVPARRIMCHQHRRELWNKLVDRRDTNDKWLQAYEWNRHTQNLRSARAATKRGRVNGTGYFRGCRVSFILQERVAFF